jgi:hypothetical protein
METEILSKSVAQKTVSHAAGSGQPDRSSPPPHAADSRLDPG